MCLFNELSTTHCDHLNFRWPTRSAEPGLHCTPTGMIMPIPLAGLARYGLLLFRFMLIGPHMPSYFTTCSASANARRSCGFFTAFRPSMATSNRAYVEPMEFTHWPWPAFW